MRGITCKSVRITKKDSILFLTSTVSIFYESPEHVARLHLKSAFTSSIECNQFWTKGNDAAQKVFAEI